MVSARLIHQQQNNTSTQTDKLPSSSDFSDHVCTAFRTTSRDRGIRSCVREKHSQVEALVELGRPDVVLGLGLEPALLVAEVRPDDADLHEGSEHAGRLPLQVAGSQD